MGWLSNRPSPEMGAAAISGVRYTCPAVRTAPDEIGSPGACGRTAAPAALAVVHHAELDDGKGSGAPIRDWRDQTMTGQLKAD